MGDDNVNNEGRHGQDTNTKNDKAGRQAPQSDKNHAGNGKQAEKPGSDLPDGRWEI
jgi:hypothetical protein